MNTTNPAKWLELATSKASNRPDFQTLHGNIGADGFRVHRDNSLPAAENDELVTRLLNSGTIPTQSRNRSTVSRLDLLDACKRAYALRDDWDRKNKNYPQIRFSMNGTFTYSATSETTGRIAGEIVDGLKVTDKVTPIKNGLKYHTHTMVYKRHSPENCLDFALSSKYLMDALEGMEGDTVEIDIPTCQAPFYMTDGTHEAVIMPISLI